MQSIRCRRRNRHKYKKSKSQKREIIVNFTFDMSAINEEIQKNHEFLSSPETKKNIK